MQSLLLATAAVGAATLFMCTTADACPQGSPECEDGVLLASDGTTGDTFGARVAMRGGRLAVSALKDDAFGPQSGAVYVFAQGLSGWTEQVKLIEPGGTPNAKFGIGLAIEGDRLAIGASGGDGLVADSGTAYVYQRIGGAWTQMQKLLPPDLEPQDNFGASVALDGDTIAVGAHFRSAAVRDSGAVYVFEFDGLLWNQVAMLTASDAAINDRFGNAVDLDGDRMIIGTGKPFAIGSAYVFERVAGVWTEAQKLVPLDPVGVEWFGSDVAIEGGTVIVGAQRADAVFENSGAAYVFRDSGLGYVETQILVPSADVQNSLFATSLDLVGGRAAIGARYDGAPGVGGGAVYVFSDDGAAFSLVAKLIAGDAVQGDDLGIATALEGDLVASGADDQPFGAEQLGAVYFHDLGSLAFESYGIGTTGSGGFVPILTAGGCAKVLDSTQLRVSKGLGGTIGAFVLSTGQASIPALGGTILVFPATFLIPHVLSAPSSVPGAGSITYELPLVDPAWAGVTFYAQCGYVDPGAAGFVSLSNGLRVSLE
jgi:hypothetical protein